MREITLKLSGAKPPKTKRQALDLLGVTYADLHAILDKQQGKEIGVKARTIGKTASHRTEKVHASQLTYKDKNWDFRLYFHKIKAARLDPELLLRRISGSKIDPGNIKALAGIGQEEFFTLAETTKLLKACSTTILKLAKSGELEAFKLGGSWRFTGTGIKKVIMRGDK
ncbi:MAG: helix-turn-helix domain-containing protein [Candidatus Subteraquimicrobiales bacterium]|nr:helix-turn-helix domain-containing protein [Candidatus Subteraquimicrobiales bacterium]